MSPERLPEPSDEECVARARAGDRTAFSLLVRRHQQALHRYLARMVGSSDEALELAQDAFLRAWQALPQFEPEAAFRTWLFRIGGNAALDALRRRKVVEFVPMGEAFDAPDAGPDPERQASGAQEVRALEAALARLTPEHREVLLLREIEDMSYEEIGRVLRVNEGTVKSRLARARAALIGISGRKIDDR